MLDLNGLLRTHDVDRKIPQHEVRDHCQPSGTVSSISLLTSGDEVMQGLIS